MSLRPLVLLGILNLAAIGSITYDAVSDAVSDTNFVSSPQIDLKPLRRATLLSTMPALETSMDPVKVAAPEKLTREPSKPSKKKEQCVTSEREAILFARTHAASPQIFQIKKKWTRKWNGLRVSYSNEQKDRA